MPCTYNIIGIQNYLHIQFVEFWFIFVLLSVLKDLHSTQISDLVKYRDTAVVLFLFVPIAPAS